MSRIEKWILVAFACAAAIGCSDSSDISLADGLTPEQEAQLVERSLEEIESSENFTAETFELIQQAHFETMAEEMREAALANLKRRQDKVRILEMSQTVELDRESAIVESRSMGPDQAVAIVTVTGKRTYHTSNATKTAKSGFSLPWIITIKRGDLVYQHRGVRTRDLRD
jgi:hypothetical protein